MRAIPPLTGHLDMALSNFAKGYRNADLIADYLFPRVPVLRQTDRYYIWGKENLQLTEQTLRAPGTPAAETRFTLSTDNYFCDSHAAKATIPDEDRQNYPGDLTDDIVAGLQDKILLDREFRAAALATNAANFPVSHTIALSAGAQWDQGGTTTNLNSNSDPFGIAKLARKAVAKDAVMKVNTLFLGFDVAEALRVHPALIGRFQYTTVTGQLSDQQLAQVFNVPSVIVGGAVTNDQVTGANTWAWSNFALFAYVTPTVGGAGLLGAEGKVGQRDLSFGKTFTWVNAPQTIGGYGVVQARVADPTAKADLAGVDWYSQEKITAAESGFLVTNVLNQAG